MLHQIGGISGALKEEWIPDCTHLHDKNALEEFLAFLEHPQEAPWRSYALYRGLMIFSMEDLKASPGERRKILERERFRLEHCFPPCMGESITEEERFFACHHEGAVTVCGAFSAELMKGEAPGCLYLALSLEDENCSEEDWRGFLKNMNLLQFLEGSFFSVSSGMLGGRYEGLPSWQSKEPRFDEPELPEESGQSWKEISELMLHPEERAPLLEKLRLEGWEPPEVGFDLTDENGLILAQAELAWKDRRVVFLEDQEKDQAPIFEEAGWKILQLSGSTVPEQR